MSIYQKIPVIIPAYEPDEKLITLLEQLDKTEIERIVVIDDGSGPAYASIFERAALFPKCVVMHHAVNLGKGRALKTAFNECLNRYPDSLGCITADSDGQHTPEDIIACMKALEQNPEALILGCRNFDGADVPARSSFGNKCTIKVFQFLVGLKITDTQTGLRAIPGSFMKKLLSVKGERFEFETNMLIETKDEHVEIKEVPIHTIYIEENSSSHFNPIKDSIRIYMVFGKFLFSSLSSSAVDLLLFSLFCSLLRDVSLPASYIVVCTVLARIFSAVYNYLLNYKMVFNSSAGVKSTAVKYFLLAVCQMTLSAVLVNSIYPLVGGLEVLVKVPVDIILFFASFVIQREVVYRKRGQK